MRTAAIGFLALALFVAAIVATGFVLTGGLRTGTTVRAIFSAPGVGQQLPIGGDVKVRGVLVGTITALTLGEDNTAVVEFVLKDDAEIPAESGAEIRSKTVFGQKWVELRPPETSSGELLVDGSVIPDEQTREPLELERALQLGHDLLSELPLQDLAAVFDALAEGFTGVEDEARTALDRGIVALRAVNARSDEFDLSLRQLREFSEWLDLNDDDLVTLMDAFDQANTELVGAAPEFRASLQSVPIFLDDLADFQVRVEEDLGRLVEEGATVAEILAARSGQLTDLVVQLEPFLKVWNSGLSQPCRGEYEANLTCWQIYQLPGLESRGLYGGSAGPHRDDPSDPGVTRGRTTTSSDDALTKVIGAPLESGRAR